MTLTSLENFHRRLGFVLILMDELGPSIVGRVLNLYDAGVYGSSK